MSEKMGIDEDIKGIEDITEKVKFDDAVKTANEGFNKLAKMKLNFSGKNK